ncbi:DUF3325 domain-containing protein [Variovorax guangxiensis]|uniref:DUF3325 domain-containing protein n=1 Tax=Variovorax guangxiensis TaxID=1775474 RepID=A0A502DT42_9BURK|nr:DUF3325 domain-containing protein [Variovorax guangxiensis]TPG24395.1 DUF3325 domain-containing protein [Variovorax ginsengisoli]TPG28645.1 DUF3325 domain-containing protein [Variovorax guangxiensis]
MVTALALLGLCVPGMMAIALAMERHHDVLARRWRGRRARCMLRLFGWVVLGSALLYAVDRVGRVQGLILWLGMLTPSAVGVVGLIAGRHARATHRATHG